MCGLVWRICAVAHVATAGSVTTPRKPSSDVLLSTVRCLSCNQPRLVRKSPAHNRRREAVHAPSTAPLPRLEREPMGSLPRRLTLTSNQSTSPAHVASGAGLSPIASFHDRQGLPATASDHSMASSAGVATLRGAGSAWSTPPRSPLDTSLHDASVRIHGGRGMCPVGPICLGCSLTRILYHPRTQTSSERLQ